MLHITNSLPAGFVTARDTTKEEFDALISAFSPADRNDRAPATCGIGGEVFVLMESTDSASGHTAACLFRQKMELFTEQLISSSLIIDAVLSQNHTQEKVTMCSDFYTSNVALIYERKLTSTHFIQNFSPLFRHYGKYGN